MADKAYFLKVSIFTLILSTLAIWSYAQPRGGEYPLFVGGLVAGANFNQVDGDGYKGYNDIGINVGGIVYIPFNNVNLPFPGTIAASMEVLYTEKGAFGREFANGVYQQRIKLRYGQIPFMLNYFQGTRKFTVGMGLSVGYLASEEETIDIGGGQVLKDSFPFKKYDLAFVFSPSIHVYQGFFVNLRFDYSLLPVRGNAGGYGRNAQYNNTLSLRVMYLFGGNDSRRY